jgi:hypothetical protein
MKESLTSGDLLEHCTAQAHAFFLQEKFDNPVLEWGLLALVINHVAAGMGVDYGVHASDFAAHAPVHRLPILIQGTPAATVLSNHFSAAVMDTDWDQTLQANQHIHEVSDAVWKKMDPRLPFILSRRFLQYICRFHHWNFSAAMQEQWCISEPISARDCQRLDF